MQSCPDNQNLTGFSTISDADPTKNAQWVQGQAARWPDDVAHRQLFVRADEKRGGSTGMSLPEGVASWSLRAQGRLGQEWAGEPVL